jgi:hypothetical protein
MKGGKRAPSEWNLFVKKIFNEGKSKNSSYAFKDALKDASRRKSEMGSSSSQGTKKMKKSRSRRNRGKKSTRRRRH